MKRKRFDYYIEREILENYRKKPLEVRLKWLFMGNQLRKYYPKKVLELQDKIRKGKI